MFYLQTNFIICQLTQRAQHKLTILLIGTRRLCYTVSVLGEVEGYTAKYFLNGGFRPYFAVYPESSPNTDIISFIKVTLWPFLVLPSEVGLYWKS